FPGTSAGDPYAIHQVDELSDMVLVYEELTRRLGLDHPSIVGQSFGGMLAAEVAAAYPALPGKVVLLDPVGLWRDDAPVVNPAALAPQALPEVLFKDPNGPAAQAMLALPDDPDAAVAAQAAMMWALGATAKFTWPIIDRGLGNRLHRIAAPTLIVWGRDDALAPVAYADEFATRIPHSRVAIVDDCGHIPQVEQFGQTAALVEEFLTGHTAPAAQPV
ncbi:MAG: alpha/beta fold hydrolase, partial [Actinophytocola sp.]|nr:alpha/beta fold hydrolase [Actinophytocola sp.]